MRISDWSSDVCSSDLDRPVIFAYHGYPWLVHRLTHNRTNHRNFHVRGYVEEGTTTTPFDMTVLNGIDRFHLALDVIDQVPQLRSRAGAVRERLLGKLVEHRHHVPPPGEDMAEVRDWQRTEERRVGEEGDGKGR